MCVRRLPPLPPLLLLLLPPGERFLAHMYCQLYMVPLRFAT